MRNASGLTAANLAHAQGFQECAEILSNAQNFQQNMAQSHNGAFLNGVTQIGGQARPTIQGRSFSNGVPNRKRSFDGMEANAGKKARPNGRSLSSSNLCGYVWIYGFFQVSFRKESKNRHAPAGTSVIGLDCCTRRHAGHMQLSLRLKTNTQHLFAQTRLLSV